MADHETVTMTKAVAGATITYRKEPADEVRLLLEIIQWKRTQYLRKNKPDAFQKIQTDACMDGVNAMCNLVMRGSLERPLLPRERQQTA